MHVFLTMFLTVLFVLCYQDGQVTTASPELNDSLRALWLSWSLVKNGTLSFSPVPTKHSGLKRRQNADCAFVQTVKQPQSEVYWVKLTDGECMSALQSLLSAWCKLQNQYKRACIRIASIYYQMIHAFPCAMVLSCKPSRVWNPLLMRAPKHTNSDAKALSSLLKLYVNA